MNTEEILRTREDPIHRQIFLEVDKYIYSSGFAKFLTVWGHQVCSKLRKFDRKDCTVLDLGCGPGYHFRYIKKATIVGMDNMPEMVETARQTAEFYRERCKIVEGDIFDNPLPDGSVDSIVSSGVFEHLLPLEVALSETKRVLKTGGELILLQPCEGPLYRLGRKLTTGRYIKRKMGVDYQKYLDTEHVHECSDLLGQVSKVFGFDKALGIPFGIPLISINAFVAVRFEKR